MGSIRRRLVSWAWLLRWPLWPSSMRTGSSVRHVMPWPRRSSSLRKLVSGTRGVYAMPPWKHSGQVRLSPPPVLFRPPLHRRCLRVLELEPVTGATGAIARTEPLRHDPLKPHLAGVLEHSQPALVLQVLV